MPQSRLTPIARRLRSDPTGAEKILWPHLRAGRIEGWKFRRQAPVGGYIADFLCEQARLVIELDGGQHCQDADAPRTAALERAGYIVLRFWNNDVLANTQGVLEEIRRTLHIASP